jgi:D-alanyl-D-alanine carboxypeptidase
VPAVSESNHVQEEPMAQRGGVLRRRAAGLLAGLALAACGGGDGGGGGPTGPDNTITTVVVTLSAASLEAGATATATATARNARGETVPATFTWSSSESRVATVGADGAVRGAAPGTASIRATAAGVMGSAELQVRTRNIDALVASIRKARGLPAMAGAIVTVDGIVAMGVAGTRRVTGGAAVTAQDVWHIGSNLKAITAALAAVAVEQGRISWTTTVEQAFPELAASMRPAYREVTLEDLLSNRGGIRNDPPASAYTGSTARSQRDGVAAWALGAAPIGPRGGYHYSNPSFVIAGAMVERAMGGTYEDLIASQLAAPLGVSGIGWGPTTAAGGTNQPVGHRRQSGQWVVCEACDNPPGLSAAGRAHMPLATWGRIVQEMLRADAGTSTLIRATNGPKLFTHHTPMPSTSDQYALGWIMTTRPWAGAGGRTAVHSGSNTLNHSVAWLGLGNGVAFLALTNAADLDGGLSGQALDALIVRLLELHQTGN